MKTRKVHEISKKMNMDYIQLIDDIEGISKLGRDFQNKLDEILLIASIHVDQNITSYDEDKEYWLKLYSEDGLNKLKQEQFNKLEYILFLREWLDYPVLEPAIELDLNLFKN